MTHSSTQPTQYKTYSWGRLIRIQQKHCHYSWRHNPLPKTDTSLLPYGLGRSYGDSCLNEQGHLLLSRTLNKLIAFDHQSGRLRCEAGVSLQTILRFAVPQGWFLPVTPGTQFVTLGGAIANDVHGKNHQVAGTLGNHITAFELLRSDGSRLMCSPTQNQPWYAATIAGLGLTGLITWAEIQLIRIHNPYLWVETIRYSDLEQFLALSEDSQAHYDYTVAWVDCLAKGRRLGRGHFIRANFAGPELNHTLPSPKARNKIIPCNAPNLLLNTWTVKCFNQLYYYKQLAQSQIQLTHYEPFFYPLDSLLHWNKVYGNRGFYQYQCVIPKDKALLAEIIKTIAASGLGSFLTVLKEFGTQPSPGLLSFPRAGYTYALDFPNTGPEVLNLFERLDRLVIEAKGALYPAKDARMPAQAFAEFNPNLEQFIPFIDPQFSSNFWRRVYPNTTST